MRRVLAVALLLASCGGAIVTPSSTPTVATSTTAPTATPRGTASVAPTPITSTKGGITVSAPLSNARITSPVTISGDASVFEANLQWRVVDGSGTVLAQGITTASAGAPARGTFSVTASFAPPASDVQGGVEVYTRSPKDGTIDELVRVPVVIGR